MSVCIKDQIQNMNLVIGCTVGCQYCYARNNVKRWHMIDDFAKPEFFPGKLKMMEKKRPQNFLLTGMSDLAGWQDEWRNEVFAKIRENPQHQFLFLSKRPDLLNFDTEAKQLFNAVNKELDTMLEGILGKAETPEIDENFNDTLAQALSEHQWSAEQFEQFAKAVEPSLQAMDRLRSIAFDEEKYKKIVELSNLYSPVLQQEYEKLQEISQKALSPEVVKQLERLAKMEQTLTANYDKIANALQTLQPFLKNPDDASTVGPDNNSDSTQKPEQSKEEQVEESDEANPS